MVLAGFFLVIAAFFLFFNMHIRTGKVAKALTFYALWLSVAVSIVLAVRSEL